MINIFKGKKILITGGTGSFGNAITKKLLTEGVSEIRVFSRDEKKQDDMRKEYQNHLLKFYLGDIRDRSSVQLACVDVDFIFHAAALKQVPSCEFFPMEAVKTNVFGTDNLLSAAIDCKVKKVICLSTDKAVYPINAMGISKAMMEKVAIARSRDSTSTEICITRYGNVMGSRGSVIPLFYDQVLSGKGITVTDRDMTRFMMSLDDAVSLVIFAFRFGKSGDLFVQKAPAASINTLIQAIKKIMKVPDLQEKVIGTRHGEKKFEVLLSREEKMYSEDLGDYYKVSPDNRGLNYEIYMDQGDTFKEQYDEYNSHNTLQLSTEELELLLYKMDLFKKYLN
jgi:UDP-N-acetylglucosamine 4,6-dehydratase